MAYALSLNPVKWSVFAFLLYIFLINISFLLLGSDSSLVWRNITVGLACPSVPLKSNHAVLPDGLSSLEEKVSTADHSDCG